MITLNKLAKQASESCSYDFAKLLADSLPGTLDRSALSESIPAIVESFAVKVDRHRNGFSRALLCFDRQQYASVRAHCWTNKGFDDHGADIHNHAWDFCSFVCCGSMVVQNFLEQSGDDFQRNIAPTGKLNLGEPIKAAVSLLETENALIHRHNWHKADCDMIHFVRPLTFPCVSIFFQGPHKRGFSYFFVKEQKRVSHPIDLNNEERTDLAKLLKRVLSKPTPTT